MFARNKNLDRQSKARTFDDVLGYDYVRNFVLGSLSVPIASPHAPAGAADMTTAFKEAALAAAAAERSTVKAAKAEKKVRIAQSQSSSNLPTDPSLGVSAQKLPSPSSKPAPTLQASQSAPIFPNRVYQNRSGGPESYTEMPHGTIFEPKLASTRCYRVLTYIHENGRNVLIDISNGYRYKDWADKLTKNGVVYDTKVGALSERFAPSQVTPTRGGNGYAPRVLVAFDCWGHSHKRYGGGSSLVYETVKYVGIVKCIDPVTPYAKKTARMPKAPFYFPGPDNCPPPRQPNNRDVRINRSIKSFA